MQPSDLKPIGRIFAVGADLYTAEQMADALESAMDAVLRKPLREELAWRDVIKELRLKE
jgi:hypothetical protein